MNLKHLLLLSTALTMALVGWATPPANAACTSYAPSSNTTVICSGSVTTGISANSNTSNVTIILEDGASLATTQSAISPSGSGNSVELRADSSVSSSGGTAISVGNSSASDNHVVLYGNSTAASASFFAVVLQGSLGSITLYDNATLKSTGSASAVAINGNYNSIDLNDSSLIQTTGTTSAHGITVSGNGNTITVDHDASIDANGSAINIRSGGSNKIVNYGSLVGDVTAVSGSNSNDTVENYGALVGNLGTAVSLNGGDDALTLGTGSDITGSIDGGSGTDTVSNYGTISGSIDLSGGDDSLVLGTGSDITGGIDGGSGTDTVTLLGSGSEDSDFANFESLTMAGTEWVLSGTSSFGSIQLDSGILRLNGSVTGDVQVAAAATLGGTGMIIGNVTSFGTLSAGNSVGTATIVGDLVQNGGSFVEFDAGGVDRWDVTGTATLVNNPTLTITSLDGSTTAYGVILHADGGIIGSFAEPLMYDGNGAAFLEQTDTDIILAVVEGTAVAADHHASIETGLSFLDELTEQDRGLCRGEQPPKSSLSTCRDRFWVKAFGQHGKEEAHDGNKAFAYAIGGMAMGAEARAARDLTLGASFGYGASAVEVAGDAGSTKITSILGAFYADARSGPGFLTASVGGGWQDLDLFRTATVSSQRFEVESDSSALLLGGNVLAGVRLQLEQGWTLTPTVGATYLRQWVGGYEEGFGPAAATIGDHDADLLRLRAEVEARHSRTIEGVQYSPYLSLGLVDDLAGGGKASGAFSTGTSFELSLDGEDELKARAGLGFDAGFENGSTISIAYHAETSGTSAAHLLEADIRLLW